MPRLFGHGVIPFLGLLLLRRIEVVTSLCGGEHFHIVMKKWFALSEAGADAVHVGI